MNNKLVCSIEGCNNLRMSSGNGHYHLLCTKHHKQKYGMKYSLTKPSSERGIYRKFKADTCVLCGWDGPCDRHRLIKGKEGGEYVKGNVVSLCPNCHRLLHFGKLSSEVRTPLLQ